MSRKNINYIVVIFIFLISLGISYYTNNTNFNNKVLDNSEKEQINIPADTLTDLPDYKVIRTVDGDTIKVYKIINKDNNLSSPKLETIRMIGVDTPETVDPRKVVQCFGKEASNWTKNKLTNKNIKLEFDNSQEERDKYKRLLAYVILDGVNFNEELIKNGYAHEYTYNPSGPYKYQKKFKDAEKYARENKLGLWADGACGEKNVN